MITVKTVNLTLEFSVFPSCAESMWSYVTVPYNLHNYTKYIGVHKLTCHQNLTQYACLINFPAIEACLCSAFVDEK